MIKEFDGSNEIKTGLLYFYSNYSTRCNIFLDAINKTFNKLSYDVLKINTTKFREIKRKYSINKIPSFVIINDSNVISKLSGVVDSYTLDKWVNNNLNRLI